MTKKKSKIVVKKVVYEELRDSPFSSDIGLRELSRRTGIDVGYLSRVRSGKSPITEENLAKIQTVLQGAVV